MYRTITSIGQGQRQLAGEADNVSSLSASACHIGGPVDVNPGEFSLVYGTSLAASTMPKNDHSKSLSNAQYQTLK